VFFARPRFYTLHTEAPNTYSEFHRLPHNSPAREREKEGNRERAWEAARSGWEGHTLAVLAAV